MSNRAADNRAPLRERTIAPPPGPLLLFGGAYSNLEALLALRAEAERLGIPPGRVICTGDTPGYCSDPAACLELVEGWGIHAIAGNVETNLANGTDDCGCGFGDGSRCDMFSRLWYAYASAHVDDHHRAYMAGLADVLRFDFAGRRVAVLHGSPRDQSEFVWASTDWATKAAYLDELGADVVIGGHCGLPFLSREPGGGPRYWINPGVIGMPANDGTPRTWYALLDTDTAGQLRVRFRPLHYDHARAKAKMMDDRRLPVSYAATLTTGLWDNTEIMPPAEEAAEGTPLDFTEPPTKTAAPAAPPPRPEPTKLPPVSNSYYDPKDLKKFGKIAEWQEEMGEKFFAYYSGVTEGDSALTEREKALIALAVSHAIQCPYCIDAYTTNSLQSGADEEQMMEAVHVAAAVKAGTTLIYARQMQRQVDKITM